MTGVRQLFKRKFGYESTDYPTFESLRREDSLDVEVSCSGFGLSKEMEDDLLQEYGITDGGEDSDSDDGEVDAIAVSAQLQERPTEYSADELAALRQQVEDEVQLTNAKPKTLATVQTNSEAVKFDPIANYIQSVTAELSSVQFDVPVDDLEDTFEDASDIVPVGGVPFVAPAAVGQSAPLADDDDDDDSSRHSNEAACSVSSIDLQEADDDLADLDKSSREYRARAMEQVKVMLEARSQRSYSTTASTIAPTVIKGRIKKTIELQGQRDARKRCLAKGEANATTRGRKENKDTVKEYAGWDY